jgi:putative FmdB family regulatory protein
LPIYEYECESCHRRTERMQKLSDPPLEKCDHCGGKLRKIISAPGIQFKGSGWYVTDYSQKMKSTEGKKPETEKKKESQTAATGPKSDPSSKSPSASKSDGPSKSESSSKADSSPKPDTPSKKEPSSKN